MLLQIKFCVLSYLAVTSGWITEGNRKLEEALMKSYNRKHRPVKKDSTTMQIQIYLLIGHIEKVDEHEQTMLLHGLLWTSWIDEYLKWDPSKYNNTRRIAIESWKIWQPALSLYNSARGNSWYLYMSGLPASVNNDGKVWASGSFSFHVTCLFDFTNYPYDEQECPIVIADWIYDLSKVNLSDPSGNTGLNKPTIKLSYDPLDNTNTKRYVAGCWEVKDTWRRQCYWGPTGCKDEPPDSQPEWFWSLIEFGIRIKRNVPYFGLTFILPTIITCFLTLIVFWIDTMSLAITTAVMNILLQGLYSWEFIKNLPPGSGGIPKIVSFYGMNLSLTGIAFILHVIITYLIYILPENLELPFQLTDITERLKQIRPFKLLTGDYQNEEYHQQDQQKLQRYDNVIAMDQNPILPSITTTGSELELNAIYSHIPSHSRNEITTEGNAKPVKNSDDIEIGHIAQQLYVIRRLIFFIFLLIYIISLPICLF
ncbi:Acetylcholine receptor-like protein [Dirofilaria immitis]